MGGRDHLYMFHVSSLSFYNLEHEQLNFNVLNCRDMAIGHVFALDVPNKLI